MTTPGQPTATRDPTSPGPPATLPAALRQDWRRLSAATTGADRFGSGHLEGLPDPVRRWLTHAIAPGTPLLRSAVLRQHGQIKVGRWQRYEADRLLAPMRGFIWAATSHLGPVFIRGFDRYTEGAGSTGRAIDDQTSETEPRRRCGNDREGAAGTGRGPQRKTGLR